MATISLALILNIILNLLFIPLFGAVGAAYTTVITLTICAISRAMFLWVRVTPLTLDIRVISAAIATLGLWAILEQVKGYSTLIVIIGSIPVYLFGLVVMRTFTRSEVTNLPFPRLWLNWVFLRRFFPE